MKYENKIVVIYDDMNGAAVADGRCEGLVEHCIKDFNKEGVSKVCISNLTVVKSFMNAVESQKINPEHIVFYKKDINGNEIPFDPAIL